MAINSSLQSLDNLQGLEGQKFESVLTTPLPDGHSADVVVVTLPESLLAADVTAQTLRQHISAAQGRIAFNSLLSTSARFQCYRFQTNKVWGIIEDIAAGYNGDLQAYVAFDSKRFQEIPRSDIFSSLPDHTVAGVTVPNPKKSFVGKCLTERVADGFRFAFVAAHFPITKISAVLEAGSSLSETLEASKRILAGFLRDVLRKASKLLTIDGQTILFLQGDLNSRTVLTGIGAVDLLREILGDRALQRGIQRGLGLPPGRWYEVALPNANASNLEGLPVSYKFVSSTVSPAAKRSTEPSRKIKDHLTLGDVMSYAAKARPPPAQSVTTVAHRPELYQHTLNDARELCTHWGVVGKASGLKPFRFPASADRMLYWASDQLAERISWETFGGYSVNHLQLGSDHKPVFCEAVLSIYQPGVLPQASQEDDGDNRGSIVLDDYDLEDDQGSARSGGGSAPSSFTSSVGINSMIDEAYRMGSSLFTRPFLRPSFSKGWNWTPDGEAQACELCTAAFTVVVRRHHCRLCGRCVCSPCSPTDGWRSVEGLGSSEPARVCIACAETR